MSPETLWHTLSTESCLDSLRSSRSGLTEPEVTLRLSQYGPNELKKAKRKSLLAIIISQFNNFLIYLLLAAVVISLVLGEYVDSAIIAAIIILNALLGTYQEAQAERSIESIQKYMVREAFAIRDGQLKKVDAATLVPGDVIQVEAGDYVPADARLINLAGLGVDESPLTGESVQSVKSLDMLTADSQVGDQENMLFAGTMATSGRGTAVVVRTGMNTEIGRIAGLVESGVKRDSPVQISLDRLGKMFVIAALIICGLIFVVGLLEGQNLFDMFLISVSLAVAAIPEGLPAAVTIIFALGIQRMAREHAIVRKIAAVETLGSTSVICTDKTGTLTQNVIIVQRIVTGTGEYEVTGEGYSSTGSFKAWGRPAAVTQIPEIVMLLNAGVLCNNATYIKEGESIRVLGDSTEVAILVAAAKAGIYKAELEGECPRRFEESFSSETRFMLTANDCAGNVYVYAKGAPEVVLDMSTHVMVNGEEVSFTAGHRERFLEQNRVMAAGGMRVLGIAFKQVKQPLTGNIAELKTGLTFLGLTGMIDPPRPEVKTSIAQCRLYGIDVIMITGDQLLTAVSIARDLGIYKDGDEAVTGTELSKMSDTELDRRIGSIKVFARTSPDQKMRIIHAIQKLDQVVAMTGDGVNDAPALKMADIGVSMGLSGTEVARQASDIVLVDDNFTTIVKAVEEGRTIYDNVRKAVMFLFSSNLGEVLTIFIGIMLNLPLPLLAIQILWINLITDSLPSLALGIDPPDKRAMIKPPRPRSEGIITRIMAIDMIIIGIVMSAGTLWLFYSSLSGGIDYARTVAFASLVIFQVWNGLNCKSNGITAVSRSSLNNPYLAGAMAIAVGLIMIIIYVPPFQVLFNTVNLSVSDWLNIVIVSSSVFVVVELRKLAWYIWSTFLSGNGIKKVQP